MPAITIHPPGKHTASETIGPLPPVLQTPAGLAMIEFQGSILTEGDDYGNSLGSIDLGRLVFPSALDPANTHNMSKWDGRRVFLFVGRHQRLTGEVKKLAKPIAVIRKREPDQCAASGAQEELEVAAIVTQKILFAHRPEPVGMEQVVERDSE